METVYGGVVVIEYVEAPHTTRIAPGWPAVFLAGGITGCPDWQAVAHARLRAVGVDAIVYNPRRANFDRADPDATRVQVAWEATRIRTSEVVLFWFCGGPGLVQPIALYELGAALERHRQQDIIIGADPTYPRRLDVVLQVANAAAIHGRDWVVHEALARTVDAAADRLHAAWDLRGGPVGS